MPALQDSHIVKIAVELENQTAQLIEFDQRSPLTRKFDALSPPTQQMLCVTVVLFFICSLKFKACDSSFNLDNNNTSLCL